MFSPLFAAASSCPISVLEEAWSQLDAIIVKPDTDCPESQEKSLVVCFIDQRNLFNNKRVKLTL